MTQILNVTRNDDGQYEITDPKGKVVEGPFDTNAAAWRALDRLDQGGADAPPKRRSKKKKVLWGKPEKVTKSPHKPKSQKVTVGYHKRKSESEPTPYADDQMRKNAAKAPGWVRSVAAVKFDPAGQRAYRDQKLGTFGAASPVKRIDPAEYLAAKARGEA
jgi:hypothetical protein